MAAKRTLKYKRNKRPPLIEGVNKLIQKTLDALERGSIKVSVSDLVRIVHLKKKLYPSAPVPGTVTWIDRRVTNSPNLYSTSNQRLPEVIPRDGSF